MNRRAHDRSNRCTYTSIAARVQQFLKLKQSLGFKMETEGILLNQFAQFASQRRLVGPLKARDLVAWATGDSSHTRRYQVSRLSIVRSFARHCAAEDGVSEVPPARLLSLPPRRKQPHIFTPQQIAALMAAAQRLAAVYPHRPLVYAILLGLLACTGIAHRIENKTGVASVETPLSICRLEL